MRGSSGAGTVSTCAPSTARPCACPTQDAIATFGQMFPAHSAPATLARISQVYDPLKGPILDALIAPYHRDERDLLVEHLVTLEAGCLLLFAVLAGATSYQKIITFIAVQRDRLNTAFGA